mmetsp:Transcript_55033/g.134960  ORF Transcript_55033/g.134960 Transcript_55033/m.134960 type:complete len:260 (-) Transcript_55033:3144-3923(-)
MSHSTASAVMEKSWPMSVCTCRRGGAVPLRPPTANSDVSERYAPLLPPLAPPTSTPPTTPAATSIAARHTATVQSLLPLTSVLPSWPAATAVMAAVWCDSCCCTLPSSMLYTRRWLSYGVVVKIARLNGWWWYKLRAGNAATGSMSAVVAATIAFGSRASTSKVTGMLFSAAIADVVVEVESVVIATFDGVSEKRCSDTRRPPPRATLTTLFSVAIISTCDAGAASLMVTTAYKLRACEQSGRSTRLIARRCGCGDVNN